MSDDTNSYNPLDDDTTIDSVEEMVMFLAYLESHQEDLDADDLVEEEDEE